MNNLLQDLTQILGTENVKFDEMTRILYSTDASNYQIMPIGVTFPRHIDDVIAIHQITKRYHTPILPRGGGSSLAGQAIGQAVIIDLSRHMRRVRSINAEEKTVDVEAGLVLGHLNQSLQTLGLMFGPDPASAERATIGGIIGNNSTGAHSIRYGMTADHIKRLQVVLPDGDLVWLDEDHPTLNRIRSDIAAIVRNNQAEIEARYPKTWRTVAGYALNKIDPDNVNLNWLFAGAEGTLGTVVRAVLNLVSRPTAQEKILAVVHYDSIRTSLEETPKLLKLNPTAIELADKFLLDKTRTAKGYQQYLTFVEGDPAALLFVEFVGDSSADLEAHIKRLEAYLDKSKRHIALTIARSASQQNDVWTVRKAGLGLMMSERSEAKPISFVEDAAVPVEHLADYITDIEKIIFDEGTTYAIYAHASAGCLHVRPLINLKSLKGLQQYRNIAERVTQTVMKYQGTITGEHGQGIVRGEFTHHLFGAQLMSAFAGVKRLFDPDNRMNPGKVVNVPRMDDRTVLRYSPDYTVIPLQTRHDWSRDEGFNGTIEMCNGAGVCRKEDTGTMCPSYMATHDEAHSTRGRANALRAAISGKLSGGIGDKSLKAIYDLCLSCKACQTECPSSVDVARIKSEFLALYYDENGTPLSAQLFGNIHRMNKIGGLLPRLSNTMLNHPLGKWGLSSLFGISFERNLPNYAPKRFSQVMPFAQYDNPDAVLIIDTFTEFNHPEIGQAVMTLAEKLSLKVNVMRLPEQGCCGRPAISKGLLDNAKKMAEENIRALSQQNGDIPYLFIEPSCLSAFTDDYLTLVEPTQQADAVQIAQRCLTVEQFFAQKLENNMLNWRKSSEPIMLHGHCHQKALWGTADTLKLLRFIPQTQVSEIDSGCCGMAGSFGYEHYDVSMKIANDRLLPTIEANPNATIAATGTSCRAQIHDAGYRAKHPLEVIVDLLE
ncbi:MAG: FAD-binding and (Fe-S)-binding domain-containing protein [Anaerolineae bacterium]|nr:FAD-binding and (Fe-S)-binding domain-containing protein [Anaerolineae bacterium]MDQ7033904.1 FAD-binding and (Fe-S)-binding domain-containing protein [Anaerolineae bacterium]